jgi:HAD superfamily hydrolase (TIGR01509 family)
MQAGLTTQAFIFDIDGCLSDSEPWIAKAAMLMFERVHGVKVALADFQPFIGMGENRFIGGVAEKHRIAGFDLERDKAKTYDIYLEIIKGKMTEVPGAAAFVRSCKAAGLKTAVATSSDYVKMWANLSEIGLADAALKRSEFDAMVNGLEVERRKPFPDIFLEAARRLAVAPAACWVGEDAINGVQAAKEAGMRCVAVTTSFSEARLKDAGADIVVPDWYGVDVAALRSPLR